MANITQFLELLRTVDRLLLLEKKHRDLIEAQSNKIQQLTDRMTRLEAREEILISRGQNCGSYNGLHSGDTAFSGPLAD
jgi:hypothetical protein